MRPLECVAMRVIMPLPRSVHDNALLTVRRRNASLRSYGSGLPRPRWELQLLCAKRVACEPTMITRTLDVWPICSVPLRDTHNPVNISITRPRFSAMFRGRNQVETLARANAQRSVDHAVARALVNGTSAQMADPTWNQVAGITLQPCLWVRPSIASRLKSLSCEI
jgi:hypothetical protein